MKPYPVEFRHRVIALRAAGWATRDIAAALGVSRAWVDAVRRRHAAGYDLAPKSSANRRTNLAERAGDRLKARVAERPGTTLAGLKRDLGLAESVATVWHALRALGLSLKKSPLSRPSGPAPTSPRSGPSGSSGEPALTRIA
jgi:transposase